MKRQNAVIVPPLPQGDVTSEEWEKWLSERIKLPMSELDVHELAANKLTSPRMQAEMANQVEECLQDIVFELMGTEALKEWIKIDRIRVGVYLNRRGIELADK